MINKIFRSKSSAYAVAALALLGSLTVGLLDAGSWLVAVAQAQSSRSAPSAASSSGERPIRLSRAPVRAIRSDGANFSAVAVDPTRNEVVLQDESRERIMVYDRLADTPQGAAFSEPKRIIGGNNTLIQDIAASMWTRSPEKFIQSQATPRTTW
jgi:hypothetical protein